MELKVFELIPRVKSRDRCAIIIHYMDRPPEDQNGRKKRAIDRLITTKFVIYTLFSLAVSAMVGVFIGALISEIVPAISYEIGKSMNWKVIAIVCAVIFWLRFAPPMFGDALRELISEIEMYAAKDGYFKDENGQPIG